LLLTQTEIQKILNRDGLKYRDLARKLGVTEARVSQIFSETAANLTIKTIAKIFNRLGEEAYLTSCREIAQFAVICSDGTNIAEPWEFEQHSDYYIVLNGCSGSGERVAPHRIDGTALGMRQRGKKHEVPNEAA
jgi:transcriptional regulator with XRE-family HTH domain